MSNGPTQTFDVMLWDEHGDVICCLFANQLAGIADDHVERETARCVGVERQAHKSQFTQLWRVPARVGRVPHDPERGELVRLVAYLWARDHARKMAEQNAAWLRGERRAGAGVPPA